VPVSGNYDVENVFIEPVTEHELLTEINNLNENKSAGHDEISAKMIKTIGKEIVKPLTHIHNSTFLTGQIPHFLKMVTPISKQMKVIYLKITDQYGFDMFFKITMTLYLIL
jgi:hypothetical protein